VDRLGEEEEEEEEEDRDRVMPERIYWNQHEDSFVSSSQLHA